MYYLIYKDIDSDFIILSSPSAVVFDTLFCMNRACRLKVEIA